MFSSRVGLVCAVTALGAAASQPLSAAMILAEPLSETVSSNSIASVLFVLTDDATPLFGYSLDITIVPSADAVGSVSVDTPLTNFFDQRNLITAGGATRDPHFSVINPTPNGVFISTNTDDGSTVLAASGINDVLAEVFILTSPDAFGDFQIVLSGGSALSDAAGFPVPFEFSGGLINVVPAPAASAVFVLGAGLAIRRRRAS